MRTRTLVKDTITLLRDMDERQVALINTINRLHATMQTLEADITTIKAHVGTILARLQHDDEGTP